MGFVYVVVRLLLVVEIKKFNGAKAHFSGPLEHFIYVLWIHIHLGCQPIILQYCFLKIYSMPWSFFRPKFRPTLSSRGPDTAEILISMAEFSLAFSGLQLFCSRQLEYNKCKAYWVGHDCSIKQLELYWRFSNRVQHEPRYKWQLTILPSHGKYILYLVLTITLKYTHDMRYTHKREITPCPIYFILVRRFRHTVRARRWCCFKELYLKK